MKKEVCPTCNRPLPKKRELSAYQKFIKENYHRPDLKDVPKKDMISVLAKEWKSQKAKKADKEKKSDQE